jgi:hypothetical protein
MQKRKLEFKNRAFLLKCSLKHFTYFNNLNEIEKKCLENLLFVTFGKTIITFGNFCETRKNRFFILQRRHLFLKRIQQSQLLWEVTAENGECDFVRISFVRNFCSSLCSSHFDPNFCSKMFFLRLCISLRPNQLFSKFLFYTSFESDCPKFLFETFPKFLF